MSAIIIGGITLNCSSVSTKKVRQLRIGFITDLHYADRDRPLKSNRYYRDSIDKLAEFVSEMNRQNIDFIIELGDFKDQANPSSEESTLRFLSAVEAEIQKFNGPVYHVLGNHDHDSISKQQFLNAISNYGFKRAKNYYSFDCKGFHCIVLDSNYTSEGDEYNRGNFDWKDSFIPQDQVDWLHNDLLKNRKKPTIVFVHQRLDDIYENKDHFVKNAADIRTVLEEAGNVIIVLQGHDHRGAVNNINNIIYYTLKGAIEGSSPENNSYAILQADPDLKMEIIGYRQAVSQSFK